MVLELLKTSMDIPLTWWPARLSFPAFGRKFSSLLLTIAQPFQNLGTDLKLNFHANNFIFLIFCYVDHLELFHIYHYLSSIEILHRGLIKSIFRKSKPKTEKEMIKWFEPHQLKLNWIMVSKKFRSFTSKAHTVLQETLINCKKRGITR